LSEKLAGQAPEEIARTLVAENNGTVQIDRALSEAARAFRCHGERLYYEADRPDAPPEKRGPPK
jgi:hypothetical protein